MFLILLFSITLAQLWEPFHVSELDKYKNHLPDYSIIDNPPNYSNHNRSSLSHEVIGYLPYWEYSSYVNIDYNLISCINYFSAELNEFGDIINNHNWNNINIVEYAHTRGVKVKLCATLFGSSELTTLLSSQTNRNNAINNLVTLVTDKDADGIDIDFELLPLSQRDNLVIFMQELSQAFHDNMDDPIITMATPAIDWSNAWDYNALAQITDGLFIMAYNYFYSGSSTAGPVSPLGNYFYDIDYTVNDYITKTNGQTDKLILGLPYYGYNWPVTSSSMNSQTTDHGTALVYTVANDLSNEHGYNYNNASNAPWIYYTDSNS